MMYQLYELQAAILNPLSLWAEGNAKLYNDPQSPFHKMPMAKELAAGFELMHRLGKTYDKPAFNLHRIPYHSPDGTPTDDVIMLDELVVDDKPFGQLRQFKRYFSPALQHKQHEPVVLVFAPLSGHHATLLRDTVKSLSQDHTVFITDWRDARLVPLSQGAFHLNDYIAYVMDWIDLLMQQYPDLHVVSVCQPTVPVLAGISLMAASKHRSTPRSMTMMGGPIDTRCNPTSVNILATTKPLSWFEHNVIQTVPAGNLGAGRKVYPGFLQHTGFIAMNPDRHFQSHFDYFQQLVKGDLDSGESHRKFYDEYNAVLDLAAEYYLETIQTIFQEQALPKGTWYIEGQLVDPSAITETALLTIEGELDDISGSGQTHAAQNLCHNIPDDKRQVITAKESGHYGIFSGHRWRNQIYPQVRDFIAAHRLK
jgi:poly(3-hydroxybutyrate) depolymerase